MTSDTLFFWMALGGYVASSVSYIIGFSFAREGLRKTGTALAFFGLSLHTVSLGFRWEMAGHGPYLTTYEVLSSTVWITVFCYLLAQMKIRFFAHLGAIVMPVCFILMGSAILGTTEIKATPPSVRSIWLVIHILFAKLTIAAMTVATALAIFYIIKKRKGVGAGKSMLEKLPSIGVLDEYSYKIVVFGFINLTIMVVVGSIWANSLWGSYWTWDPLLTWSLVLWFVYGLYLHGRITFRWQGLVSAIYILMAFGCSLITFFVIPYFVKNLHSQYMVG